MAPGVAEGGLVQPRGRLPRVFDPSDRRVSRVPIPGTEPPAPRTADTARAQPSSRWRGDWRHDRRYDWRDWRRRHRSTFRIGFYYDPFGWDYMRYGIGWRLWPSYYNSSFWLNDPWQYRLPRAYGPYRWIRYHNDALLVNIYTGQVVDVEYDFFW
ncbi:MAG: RcnB family protein [Sphingomonas sp.]|nr:RcnB family protein [Sphingomonas sp.]